jgi:hypothetical protein
MGGATAGPKALPSAIRTYVAWRFNQVLPGSFRRNTAQFAHHIYPVLGPLPTKGRSTPAMERSRQAGPYLYFVCDAQERIRYVGKSLEDQVIQRWVRPGVGGPAKHFWTHSTASGGCVFNIAKGLLACESRHYTLRYVPVCEVSADVWRDLGVSAEVDLATAERAFIQALAADWNRT